ncbi:hypothetical protein BDZ45DRAFT_680059 [Acephala macrosclerotiorum]|nr:hypothetical protein BDZ45DRAFT_680059 [Acephala macrosclerotiorum]
MVESQRLLCCLTWGACSTRMVQKIMTCETLPVGTVGCFYAQGFEALLDLSDNTAPRYTMGLMTLFVKACQGMSRQGFALSMSPNTGAGRPRLCALKAGDALAADC